MKRLFYSCFFLVQFAPQRSAAQLTLSGSDYVQNFDSLYLGLAPGWTIDTNATVKSMGGSSSGVWTPGTSTRWSNSAGSFKNVASANNFVYWAAATNTAQAAATDRALALRQTATFGDPGASFGLLIDHTYKVHNLNIEFKLQSLDSSNGSKVTKWELQYGIGIYPDTFYTVSGMPLFTGGNIYSNTKYAFSFGSLLDDIRQPIRIRIVNLSASSGSGSRTMTALDDVHLSWSGIAHSGEEPFVRSVYPLNGDIKVPVGAILKIRFNRNVNRDKGDIRIWNETDGTGQTIGVGSGNVFFSGDEVFVAGVRLKSGNDYHVTFDSSIVNAAGKACLPILDTSEWHFHCVDANPLSSPEYFDAACVNSLETPGWYQFNELGEQQWDCTKDASGNTMMRIYANDGTRDIPNRDWLVSPPADLSVGAKDALVVHFRKSNVDDAVTLLLSEDYCGSGDPDSSSWILAGPLGTSGTSGIWESAVFPIPPSLLASRVYFGFLYTSGSSGSGATEVWVDSLMLVNSTTAHYEQKGALGLRVANPVNGPDMRYFFNPSGLTEIAYRIYSVDGLVQRQGREKIDPSASSHIIRDVHLPSGVYYLELIAPGRTEHCRFVVQNEF